ncbi:MAG: phosphoenolpyruvate synthase [endosymbiont of Galathealinum brachiosum]|uniref:Phosphoenolpyruvate synthase n=1 Tax=endosymbiont of Galathealinum brachiosum TaxID=2200906 RepID=A0A370DI01_9GAMM|nr:MAG: phosphoenolpyruvate synthase [endosymbiont of Galathealinum brachiosum]
MRYVSFFADVGINDIDQVGGKNASLGEMYRNLSSQGIKVPNGFATTSKAYHHYMVQNGLVEKVRHALEDLDTSDVNALARIGRQIRSWILHAEMPEDLAEEIVIAYEKLGEEYGEYPDVAVRSSATAEDLPGASFAGQQETYLNISGRRNLLLTCKRVYASLFTDRAISYRVDKGFGHMDVALSIGVQKMVRADTGSSGVMFTIDTETGFRDVILINAAWGLGENVVQGSVNPDEFYVFKSTLDEHQPILRRYLGKKDVKMIYSHDTTAGLSTRNIEVSTEEQNQFCITDEDILKLARYAMCIEKHYARPMDIEWAKDGESGELFILQARPETVHADENKHYQIHFKIEQDEIPDPLVVGKSVGKRISSGKACVILDASEMDKLKPGEVLVTDITDPDWEPVMKIASAIVTNRGGRTCHAAIIARELGVPAVVGCGEATRKIKTGNEVTVSCAEGDTGFIYPGLLEFSENKLDVSSLKKPHTHIMLNLANPELAFETSRLPVDGVGLARLEFIINTSIRIHPRALLEHDSLPLDIKQKVTELIAGYKSPVDYYEKKLAEGIGMIAAAFYPRQVIVRLSDFKSNEYASLIGGSLFEPDEENPMIGFRGAYRYPSEEFRDCFELECKALKIVREQMGLDNVDIMIPFVRSVGEGKNILKLLSEFGLNRGDLGLKIYLMCEIPANALLADQFLAHFDGFSIGSNDLTQLTLGVDRDSGLLTGFDERNEAVKVMMKMAIDACKDNNKYVGICGQAPSDFPEITRWLVKQGISSISLNPDSVLDMKQQILQVEAQLIK